MTDKNTKIFQDKLGGNTSDDSTKQIKIEKMQLRNIKYLDICVFNNLEQVNFSNNLINDISILNKFTNLKIIQVQYNKINSTYLKQLALSNLRTINLSYNNLSKFPDLNRCNNLEQLDISNNQIRDSLEHISVINTIQTCKLNSNKLDWGPKDIVINLRIVVKLVDLKVLNLHNNSFYDKYFTIIDTELKVKCLGLRVLNEKPFKSEDIHVAADFDFEFELMNMAEQLMEHQEKDGEDTNVVEEKQEDDQIEEVEEEEDVPKPTRIDVVVKNLSVLSSWIKKIQDIGKLTDVMLREIEQQVVIFSIQRRDIQEDNLPLREEFFGTGDSQDIKKDIIVLLDYLSDLFNTNLEVRENILNILIQFLILYNQEINKLSANLLISLSLKKKEFCLMVQNRLFVVLSKCEDQMIVQESDSIPSGGGLKCPIRLNRIRAPFIESLQVIIKRNPKFIHLFDEYYFIISEWIKQIAKNETIFQREDDGAKGQQEPHLKQEAKHYPEFNNNILVFNTLGIIGLFLEVTFYQNRIQKDYLKYPPQGEEKNENIISINQEEKKKERKSMKEKMRENFLRDVEKNKTKHDWKYFNTQKLRQTNAVDLQGSGDENADGQSWIYNKMREALKNPNIEGAEYGQLLYKVLTEMFKNNEKLLFEEFTKNNEKGFKELTTVLKDQYTSYQIVKDKKKAVKIIIYSHYKFVYYLTILNQKNAFENAKAIYQSINEPMPSPNPRDKDKEIKMLDEIFILIMQLRQSDGQIQWFNPFIWTLVIRLISFILEGKDLDMSKDVTKKMEDFTFLGKLYGGFVFDTIVKSTNEIHKQLEDGCQISINLTEDPDQLKAVTSQIMQDFQIDLFKLIQKIFNYKLVEKEISQDYPQFKIKDRFKEILKNSMKIPSLKLNEILLRTQNLFPLQEFEYLDVDGILNNMHISEHTELFKKYQIIQIFSIISCYMSKYKSNVQAKFSKQFQKITGYIVNILSAELSCPYQNTEENVNKIKEELESNSQFANIKLTLVLVSWQLLLKVNRAFEYEHMEFRSTIYAVFKAESIQSQVGMRIIPLELTSYLDETNEIIKVLSEFGIDPTSFTSVRAMFAANNQFDHDIQNIIELSEDIGIYEHLIIEIESIIDKYYQKILTIESANFSINLIDKQIDDEHQDSIHQFLSNNFANILISWIQGKYSDDSIKTFITKTLKNNDKYLYTEFDLKEEIANQDSVYNKFELLFNRMKATKQYNKKNRKKEDFKEEEDYKLKQETQKGVQTETGLLQFEFKTLDVNTYYENQQKSYRNKYEFLIDKNIDPNKKEDRKNIKETKETKKIYFETLLNNLQINLSKTDLIRIMNELYDQFDNESNQYKTKFISWKNPIQQTRINNFKYTQVSVLRLLNTCISNCKILKQSIPTQEQLLDKMVIQMLFNICYQFGVYENQCLGKLLHNYSQILNKKMNATDHSLKKQMDSYTYAKQEKPKAEMKENFDLLKQKKCDKIVQDTIHYLKMIQNKNLNIINLLNQQVKTTFDQMMYRMKQSYIELEAKDYELIYQLFNLLQVLFNWTEETISARYNGYLASSGISQQEFTDSGFEAIFLVSKITNDKHFLDFKSETINNLANFIHYSFQDKKFLEKNLTDQEKVLDIYQDKIQDMQSVIKILQLLKYEFTDKLTMIMNQKNYSNSPLEKIEMSNIVTYQKTHNLCLDRIKNFATTLISKSHSRSLEYSIQLLKFLNYDSDKCPSMYIEEFEQLINKNKLIEAINYRSQFEYQVDNQVFTEHLNMTLQTMMMRTFNNEGVIGAEQVFGSMHSAILKGCAPLMFRNKGEVERVIYLAFIDLEDYQNEVDKVILDKYLQVQQKQKVLILTNKRMQIKSCMMPCPRCKNSYQCPQNPNQMDYKIIELQDLIQVHQFFNPQLLIVEFKINSDGEERESHDINPDDQHNEDDFLRARERTLIFKKQRNLDYYKSVARDILELQHQDKESEEGVNKDFQEKIFDPERKTLNKFLFKFRKSEDSQLFTQALNLISTKNNSHVRFMQEQLIAKIIEDNFEKSLYEAIVDYEVVDCSSRKNDKSENQIEDVWLILSENKMQLVKYNLKNWFHYRKIYFTENEIDNVSKRMLYLYSNFIMNQYDKVNNTGDDNDVIFPQILQFNIKNITSFETLGDQGKSLVLSLVKNSIKSKLKHPGVKLQFRNQVVKDFIMKAVASALYSNNKKFTAFDNEELFDKDYKAGKFKKVLYNIEGKEDDTKINNTTINKSKVTRSMIESGSNSLNSSMHN